MPLPTMAHVNRADRASIAEAARLFGWDELRPGIEEAVSAVLSGRDVLAVLPTGYGKSAVYKIAGALLDGPTVVVSPLIALQADQVAGIDAREDAPDAGAINSSQSDGVNDAVWTDLAEGRTTYVFLSPEQLANDEVVERLKGLSVALFAVDEAHCVSAWGHDFRPDYLRLGEAIEALGRPRVLALTATGSGPVREEILERLRMKDPVVMTRGYDRPNIRLEVVRHQEGRQQRSAVLDQLAELPKPGLLYVATRRETEEYAAELTARGIRATAYHGGLGAKARRELHEQFRDDRFDVVVATSAFGMGIDKGNIRFVVHAAITESVDNYYQEVGRCGRDGESAVATLHYRPEDLGLRTFFASGKPDRGRLERVFTAIDSAARAVDQTELVEQTELTARRVAEAVNLLLEAGAVRQTARGLRPARGATLETALAGALEAAEHRERIDESRIAMVRQYAETLGCRRQFLLGYFGEQLDEPCGNCDTCSSGTAYEAATAEPTKSSPFPVDAAVRHREWGDGTVMSVEDDRITVFFDTEGYRVLSLPVVEEHDLLQLVS
jgi:ATP-dependent DNA helicase RecQ